MDPKYPGVVIAAVLRVWLMSLQAWLRFRCASLALRVLYALDHVITP